MAAPLTNPIVLNLSESFGSMLVGQFLSCVVYGINCVQLFWYFSVYENDSWRKKSLVLFLWVMDTVDHTLMLQGIWGPTISHWGSVDELSKLPPAQTHHVWTSAVVGLGVQMFFIHRVYNLSNGKLIVPAILSVLCLYQLVSTVVYLVLVFKNGTLAYLATRNILALQISDRACTAATDIGISVSIIWMLLRKGLPKWTGSRQMILRVILVTINTNLWTAIVALIDFSLLASHPKGFLYCIMEMPLSALYLSSLLGNLNARRFVKGSKSPEWNEFMSVLPEETIRDSNDVVVLGGMNGARRRNHSSEGESDLESGAKIRVDTSRITRTDGGSLSSASLNVSQNAG